MDRRSEERHPRDRLRLRLEIAGRKERRLRKSLREVEEDRGHLGQRPPVDEQSGHLALRVQGKVLRATAFPVSRTRAPGPRRARRFRKARCGAPSSSLPERSRGSAWLPCRRSRFSSRQDGRGRANCAFVAIRSTRKAHRARRADHRRGDDDGHPRRPRAFADDIRVFTFTDFGRTSGPCFDPRSTFCNGSTVRPARLAHAPAWLARAPPRLAHAPPRLAHAPPRLARG
jgi:hypothetical protein